ncbi:MAG: mraZ [Verrucomicrobiales bacterium]|nr:mraZ [Verrucomicrobiales bacterium]
MSETGANLPIFYHALYRHGVDEKRRVQIPTKWRPESEVTFTLVLWKKGQPNPCILALPPNLMGAMADKLSKMPFNDKSAEALRRLLGSNSDTVTTDKSGRICLPEWMSKEAGIEKDAVLVGMVDRFQIWNPERHQSTSELDNALHEDAYNLI